jgi:hypothetical protein
VKVLIKILLKLLSSFLLLLNFDLNALFVLYSSFYSIGIEKTLMKLLDFRTIIKQRIPSIFCFFWSITLFWNLYWENEEKTINYFNKSSQQYKANGLFWYGFSLIECKDGIQKNLYFAKEFIERSLEKRFFLVEFITPQLKTETIIIIILNIYFLK